MLDSITYEELILWFAFYQLEPFGNDWLRTGILAASFVNMSGKQVKKNTKPSDFMPTFKQAKQKQSWIQMYANMIAWGSVLENKFMR